MQSEASLQPSNPLVQVIIEDNAHEVKKSAFVGAVLDEVTDNSTKNYMGVLIYTVDDDFVRRVWCAWVHDATGFLHSGFKV